MIRSDNASSVHVGSACLICRDPNDIVDTEVSIPYEGVIAFCTRCVRDMAMCAGYDLGRTSAEWDAVLAEKEESDYIADSLLAASAEVTATMSALHRKHRNRLRQWRNRNQNADGAKKPNPRPVPTDGETSVG